MPPPLSLMYLTGFCRILPPEVESMRFFSISWYATFRRCDWWERPTRSYSTSSCQDSFLFRDYFIGALTKQLLKKERGSWLFFLGVMHCCANIISRKVFTTAMPLIPLPDLTQDKGHDHTEPSILASPHIPLRRHIPLHSHYFLHNYIVVFLLSAPAM